MKSQQLWGPPVLVLCAGLTFIGWCFESVGNYLTTLAYDAARSVWRNS